MFNARSAIVSASVPFATPITCLVPRKAANSSSNAWTSGPRMNRPEAIMLFAGFKVADGRFTMLEVVVAGVAGNVVGSWIAYGIGYWGRVELLERHGKWLHVKPKHLAWADRWFERYGGSTVFFSRMVPVVRTFISLPAGVARMPFWRFTWLTVAGVIPWVLAFALLGK